MLAGLLLQAEPLSVLSPLELPAGVPDGEGEELDLEGGDEGGTDGEEVEGDELGGTTSYTIEELEPGVVEGGAPRTGVGLTVGLEVVDDLGSTVSEVDDPPVMVKGGEMLPELPITEFNTT